MRLEVDFTFKDKLILPIHYNHIVQGFIYNNISDAAFRKFLHDKGYKYEKRNFKLFTFSRIMGKFKMNKKESTITFFSPIKLVVSSILDDFVNDFVTTLMKKEDLRLRNTPINFDKMEVHDYNNQSDEVHISMLSPMTTYSTVEIHRKKKTIYHKPGDDIFSDLIYKNLKKKYKSIYGGEAPEGEFLIKPVDENKMKLISAKYRGFIIKGWLGEYILKGDPELIKLAYDTGLGSKNAQGFGCFKIKNRREGS
ncbi:CRISPR-associated endoribonuclease Cas6 [Thermohalobacter berrensis]|uniref:CRISPR-associated endoribonuclease n=1 Tax=Thermohalobacter berrensis TaxID=99594 RepID=A0A419T1D8_9FIRM|nr:CRISPR-associated endoribonuclease Cas6 [Thermohalobacter berrensis]RKD31272.1 CRISPR-associated endoribonuclease Cas6 [Thermohalobacter berrensis]